MNEFLQLALLASKQAAQIIREGARNPKKIEYKGDVDLVTETDRRSEAAIVAQIRTAFPDHAIVAEEGSQGAPGGAKYCWYIDPLDGTTNFAHGYPCFAASIGLLENDIPIVGVVVNPMLDETFSAAKGQGAFLNGKPIHVSPTPKLRAGLVSTGFPTHLLKKKSGNIEYYWGFTLASHGVRRDGSAALDMCTVACGRFEGFWEFGLNSWDTAAGTVIVREAGGNVTSLEGGDYQPGGPTVLASNGLVHDEMVDLASQIARRASERERSE